MSIKKIKLNRKLNNQQFLLLKTMKMIKYYAIQMTMILIKNSKLIKNYQKIFKSTVAVQTEKILKIKACNSKRIDLKVFFF